MDQPKLEKRVMEFLPHLVEILANQEIQRQQILDLKSEVHRHRLERDALGQLLHTVLKDGIDKANKCALAKSEVSTLKQRIAGLEHKLKSIYSHATTIKDYTDGGDATFIDCVLRDLRELESVECTGHDGRREKDATSGEPVSQEPSLEDLWARTVGEDPNENGVFASMADILS